MTSTRLQERKAFISHQVDHFDEADHELGEDNLNHSEEDDPSPHSVLYPPSTLLDLRNSPRLLFLTNCGESFQMLPITHFIAF